MKLTVCEGFIAGYLLSPHLSSLVCGCNHLCVENFFFGFSFPDVLFERIVVFDFDYGFSRSFFSTIFRLILSDSLCVHFNLFLN